MTWQLSMILLLVLTFYLSVPEGCLVLSLWYQVYNFYDWTKIVFFMIINIKLSKKLYLSFCETLFIFYVQLNKKCSVSHGGFTLKHAQKMEKKLKNQRLRQSLFSSKRRRLELKSQAMKNSTQSVLEGIYNDINLYKLVICFYYNTCIV